MTQVTGTAHQSESFFDAAKSLTKVFAERAPDNDENDQFVAENYADLKTAGLISAGVPSDLGGGGASILKLCDVLKIIGGACGSTGLALSLYSHQVAVLAWRWYNQEAARDLVAPLLRRVADEKNCFA
jgi:alkylation response protein AidB-like acyl-CoA dehydrogenase